MSEIKEQVLAYISDNFLMGLHQGRIRDESSLLELGIIDSTGVIELVAYLEETFAIRVDDSEITPENLDSLRRIERYVLRKRAQTRPAASAAVG